MPFKIFYQNYNSFADFILKQNDYILFKHVNIENNISYILK